MGSKSEIFNPKSLLKNSNVRLKGLKKIKETKAGICGILVERVHIYNVFMCLSWQYTKL